MFSISKQFHFEASHVLDTLPSDHPCARMHGHSYTVEVVLQSRDVDEHGFVVDFGKLKRFKDYLDNTFDHSHLNDVVRFSPTCELLARHFFHWCKGYWPSVCRVRVSETRKTWGEYSE